MIAYQDTAAAIDWLTEAFGFSEHGPRYVMDDGTIGHAELELDGELRDARDPSLDYQGPKRHRQDCEAADRSLDNPWVVDGVLVPSTTWTRTTGGRSCGRERDHAARGGPGGQAVHRRGSRGPPLDVPAAMSLGYVLSLGEVPYGEAFELQRTLAGAVSQRAIPETVVFLEHPPVVTIGRRTETASELHIPEDAEVEIAETDRGGKSTFHGPGQLVCYPILDLDEARQGRQALRARPRGGAHPDTRALRAGRVALRRTHRRLDVPREGQGPRKIASIGVHVSRWVTTHGYALNVDLDPAPFTEWITACGLEDAQFTTMARELGRAISVEDVRPAAIEAVAEVFGLAFEELPADDGHGLWTQPIHASLAAR